MSRRRFGYMPLGVLVLLLGVSVAAAQENAPAEKDKVKPLSPKELAGVIDEQIAAKWAKAKAVAAAPSSDAEFLRRVYLDISGRIPKVAEARAFFESKDPARREKLIESLLEGSQYVDHFSNTWRTTMISQMTTPQASFAGRTLQLWLVDQLRKDVPYDKMVHELLTAQANSPAKGKVGKGGGGFNGNAGNPVAFFQANENKPENLAAATTRVFLGVRLECAQCHNHPFTDWKKEQFWEFAAFFSGSSPFVGGFQPPGVGGKQLPPGEIMIPNTEKKVKARFLDGKLAELRDGINPRENLADWVTSPTNPYFARTAANRMWGHFFGSGLIDPVDDEATKDNPPSHPELLKILAAQFVAHDFDLKYLIRAITLSKTYQLSGKQTHDSQKNLRLFAKAAVRGMTAEQLFDTLSLATGFQDGKNGQAVYDPIYFNNNSVRAKFIAEFASTDHPTETTTSILQALQLMNGKYMANATSVENSQTLAAVAEAPFFNTAEKIKALYLATLTRFPTETELNQFSNYVDSGGPRHDQKAALGDVFWALLNSSEFRLNH